MSINAYPPIPNFFQRSQTFTSSGTFSHPDGYASARTVFVVVMGGGAGGGSGANRASHGTTSQFNFGATGGGAGYVNGGYLTISADQTVTIGAGGNGGAAKAHNTGQGNDGSIGGVSYFGNIAAKGGLGGYRGWYSSAANVDLLGGSGGSTGGNLTGSAGTGSTTYTGGSGGTSGGGGYSSISTAYYSTNPLTSLTLGQGQTYAFRGLADNGVYDVPTTFSFMASGGGASSGGSHNAALTGTGGTGAVGFFGSGGNGGNTVTTTGTTNAVATSGTAGSGNGSGGGGGGSAFAQGASTANVSGAGGNGSAGMVIVYY